MIVDAELRSIVGRFEVPGDVLAIARMPGGHINDSYVVTLQSGRDTRRYLLQRLNPSVFPNPDQVMENIERVIAHLQRALRPTGGADVERRVLTLVRTRVGATHVLDAAGAAWRLYPWIEGARVVESVESPKQARQAGRAFGMFQRTLADYSGPRLHETIPRFHDTPRRYESLERAIEDDSLGRAKTAGPEIEFAESRRSLAGAFVDARSRGELPERIVHNDAKIGNVLFDDSTGEALCVVDLDTVMPGLSLHDFGDMVRSMTCRAPEDATDLSDVRVDPSLFEALATGYLENAGSFLTSAEREHLVAAGKVITLEQGIRFLTDYLTGDRYYRTSRPNQNLDRCRTQFALLRSIEAEEAILARIVRDRL